MEYKTKRELQGAYGIVLTPFAEGGSVEESLLEQHLEGLCASEIDGLVVCGSTSEFVVLSPEENIRIMEQAARICSGKKPLVCGATAADSRGVRKYLDEIERLGGDWALVAPPYYFPYSEQEIVAFYREVSSHGGVKIIAYQIPAFTNNISWSVYQALLEMPNVVGMKNSSADIKQIMHQLGERDRVRPEFSLLTGTDDALVPCLTSGCDGSFTALGAVLPELIKLLYHELSAGRLSSALALQNDLLPLLQLADLPAFPVGYKLLAQACGIGMGTLRQDVNEQNRSELAALFVRLQAGVDALRAKYTAAFLAQAK